MAKVTVSFHREDGRSVTLGSEIEDQGPLLLIAGAEGLGVAPTDHSTSPRVAGNGSILRGTRLGERELFIPVLVDTDDEDDYKRELESLSRFLSPLDTSALWLRVTVEGREGYREMQVRYKDGLDGLGETYRGTYGTLGLKMLALDALWSGAPILVEKALNSGTRPFLSATSPFFPITLAESVVQDKVTVEVYGDAPTWPKWTIYPPGTDLTITHPTSGVVFQLLGTLTEPVTLDMGAQLLWSESKPLGELWDQVPATRGGLFQLPPGRNVVGFSMVGSSAESFIQMSYQPQFLRGQ